MLKQTNIQGGWIYDDTQQQNFDLYGNRSFERTIIAPSSCLQLRQEVATLGEEPPHWTTVPRGHPRPDTFSDVLTQRDTDELRIQARQPRYTEHRDTTNTHLLIVETTKVKARPAICLELTEILLCLFLPIGRVKNKHVLGPA